MKSLEDGLEDEPLAYEAGGRRHRRKAHGRKQRADAEEPVPSSARIGDVIASCRAPQSIRAEEKGSFCQRVTGKMEERHRPGEAGEVVETLGSK